MRMVGAIAKINEAIIPGTTPIPKNKIDGIKYTNAGIVCMKSKIGVTIFCTVFLCAHHIPIGIPIMMVSNPDNKTIASV